MKSAQTGNTLQLLQKKRKRNHIPMLYPGINKKQCTNGITYTPMKFTISNFKE